MAAQSEQDRPVSPTGGPAQAPSVWPLLALYTLGRLLLAAALVALLWVLGLGSFPGLLFGLLLSMPLSFVLLRPLRDRLTEAMAARSVTRRASKADLRARLKGTDDPVS
ncbi:DUF4229 domain-containing protein [Klenkia brasiliensis]|uniref:DUF4229 domain-containing protein n=1 Tax=Klenkia brasiliensis TaxID=333142 RepID=A0A1G7QXI4_9ACTN|nr:DUF4229 domain-containing protein [Klenkia brasiliensis]SDG03217.1 Protein of unknown function [Klenkia brasiliensis]